MENLNRYLRENPALMHLYLNLKAQVDRLHRHARQGAYATRARYYCAMLVFLKFLAVVFHLEKLSNMSGMHLAAYIEWRQACGISAATIKSELCAIRYYHDQMPEIKHPIPSNNALSVNLERRRFGEADRSWSPDQLDAFVALARDKGKE
ncbi:MAG: site-specific integrase, partial [Oscillospiraceae bacterium]|nr:site-specific integrase [Oscillospiraceae bacterium]